MTPRANREGCVQAQLGCRSTPSCPRRRGRPPGLTISDVQAVSLGFTMGNLEEALLEGQPQQFKGPHSKYRKFRKKTRLGCEVLPRPPSPLSSPFRKCPTPFTWLLQRAVCYSAPRGSVQPVSHVRLFATPWTAARQASLSITNSWSLLKLKATESVMPSNHLILYRPLLLPPVFPASGSSPVSQPFTSGGQSTGVRGLGCNS